MGVRLRANRLAAARRRSEVEPEVCEFVSGSKRQAVRGRRDREKFLRHQAIRLPLLSEMATYDESDALRVVIETPKGCRNKYNYDPESNSFELAKVLPE